MFLLVFRSLAVLGDVVFRSSGCDVTDGVFVFFFGADGSVIPVVVMMKEMNLILS